MEDYKTKYCELKDYINKLDKYAAERYELRQKSIELTYMPKKSKIASRYVELISEIINFKYIAVINTFNNKFLFEKSMIDDNDIAENYSTYIHENFEKLYKNLDNENVFINLENDSTYNIGLIPIVLGKMTLAVSIVFLEKNFEIEKETKNKLIIISDYAAIALQNAELLEQVVSIKNYNDFILGSIVNGVIGVDIKKRINTVNTAAHKILGKEKRPLLRKRLPKLKGLLFLDDIHNELFENMTENSVRKELELEINSNIKILEIIANKIFNKSDEIIGSVFIINDITDLKELQKQIARSDRLVTVGKLAAGAAHEIRNPLSAMKGTMQLMRRRMSKTDDERNLKKVNSVLEEIERINEIVGSMMNLAQDKKMDFKPIYIHEILKSIIILLENEFKTKKIIKEFNIDETLPLIEGDMSELKQVFLNIIQNGIQALDDHGTLTLKTYFNNADNNIYVLIKDNGCGIPEDLQKNIFDPFFTTKDEGTGLGLSITFDIIKKHNGTIKVDSEENVGTAFTISFPKYDGTREEADNSD